MPATPQPPARPEDLTTAAGHPMFSPQVRGYLRAVQAASPAVLAPYRTGTCPECGRLCDGDGYVPAGDSIGEYAHVLHGGAVILGCGGLYLVDPAALHLGHAAWDDWRDTAPPPAPSPHATPYTAQIADATGLTDLTDLAAVEDMMRVQSPTLDHLTARMLGELARSCWADVRAVRILYACGLGHSLDPATITAAAVCADRGYDPPVRPVSFATRGAQVTYWVPLAEWRAGLTGLQAADLAGTPRMVRPAAGPALCRACGDIFTARPGPGGLDHGGRDGCGGRGDLLGGRR